MEKQRPPDILNMASGIERRLSKLEITIRRRRLHTLWVEPGMSDADVEAEIERRRRAGILDEMDELILFSWQSGNPTHEEALAMLEAHDSEEART
jgi:hypothetical protein